MENIIEQIMADDPHFTHLDLREINVKPEELKRIADKLEKNSVINRVSWNEGHHYEATFKKRIEDKVNVINETFQRHPTDFFLALFSWRAYKDTEKNARVHIPPNNDVIDVKELNEELKNWTVFEVFDYPEAGRFYSVAYLNKGKKQIVLAYRGTKFKLWDFAKRESPLKTDLDGILDGKIVKQQEKAYIVTEKVITHAKENGYNVSFTGHSLGAWLAELSLYFAVNNFDFQCKAVTFDSPGSTPSMNKFKPNVKSHRNNPIIKNLDITTYLSAPNLVNCCNPHVGKVYRIFPDISWINKTDEIRASLKKIPMVKHIESLLGSLLSIDGHRIKPMIATFNSEIGKPNEFVNVLDWPCFKYEPKKTNTKIRKIIQKTIGNIVPLLEYFPGIGWLMYEAFAKPTFFSFVKAIDNFVNGNIDIHQLQKVYERSEFITKGEEETDSLTTGEQFLLRYEGHYDVEAFNPLKDLYNPESTDVYLNELCKLSTNEINKMTICDNLKQSLKSLKGMYEIKFETVKNRKYISSNSPNIYVEHLREKIIRFCEVYSELKELFYNKHAFLPQDKPLTQTGTISSNLPLRSKFLLERPKVIEEIDRALNRYRVVAISAFGGTGKSTIAAEYGRGLREKLSGQIVRIIPAHCPEKIKEEYGMIAKYDLRIDVEAETANLIQSVHSIIFNLKLAVLFIFENVERYEDIKAYLDSASNILESVKVIITTRHNGLSEALQNISLNPFTREEAKLYMRKTMGNRFSLQDLDKLLDNLVSKNFYLPFNISNAVTHFKEYPMYKIERCIKDLAECNGETGSFLLRDLMNTSESSWLILQYSAYLDPDFINIEIFKELLSVDEDELHVSIKQLESLGLMSLTRRKYDDYGLKIHRLLQNLVRKYTDANEGLKEVINKPDVFESILKALYKTHLSEKDTFSSVQLCSKTGDVINNCLSWLCEFSKNSSNTSICAEKVKSAIDIVSNLGPIIKDYPRDMDLIGTGVAGGSRDPPGEGENPPHHLFRWFENLQSFVHHAHCSFDIDLHMLVLNQKGLQNQVFKCYPNDFVLGLFSRDVYTDYRNNDIVEFPSNSGVADVEAWNEELRTWTVFEVFNDPESWLYSAAYLNENKKQLVLAHYCSLKKLVDILKFRLLSNAFDDVLDGTADDGLDDTSEDEPGAFESEITMESMLSGSDNTVMGKTVYAAKVATKKVIEHAKEKGYTVSFTGHTIGTFFAVFSLNLSLLLWSYRDCKAVTFNYPHFSRRSNQEGVTSTNLEILTNVCFRHTNQNEIFEFLRSLEYYCVFMPHILGNQSCIHENVWKLRYSGIFCRGIRLTSEFFDEPPIVAAADDDESS